MLALRSVGLALVLAACYSPELPVCQVRCGSGSACPGGSTCVDGFCLADGDDATCGAGGECGDCASLGLTCGPGVDNCGNAINCGACEDGECQPLSCQEIGAQCGVTFDGCMDVIECGECTGNSACGAGGVDNQCATALVTTTEPGPCPDGYRHVEDCIDDMGPDEMLCVSSAIADDSVEVKTGWPPGACSSGFHEADRFFCNFYDVRICVK